MEHPLFQSPNGAPLPYDQALGLAPDLNSWESLAKQDGQPSLAPNPVEASGASAPTSIDATPKGMAELPNQSNVESTANDPRAAEQQRIQTLLGAGVRSRNIGQVMGMVREYEARGGGDPAGFGRAMKDTLSRLGVPEGNWPLFGVPTTEERPRLAVQRTVAEEAENAATIGRIKEMAVKDPGIQVYDDETPYVAPVVAAAQQERVQRLAERVRHRSDVLTEHGVPLAIAQAVSRSASSPGRNGELNVSELNRIAAHLRIPVKPNGLQDREMLTGHRTLEAILSHYDVDPSNW